LIDTGLQADCVETLLPTDLLQPVHQAAGNLQAPRLGIDEHALDLGRPVACLHQSTAADDLAAVTRHEEAHGWLFQRGDIDEVVALGRIERLRIGVGEIKKADHAILARRFQSDGDGHFLSPVPAKRVIFPLMTRS
jgi:hypothetical protein